MGGVEMERPLGVGLTPPTLNHQEKPPDTQSTSGGVGGGRGQPRPLSRLVSGFLKKKKLRQERPVKTEQAAPTGLSDLGNAASYKQVVPTGLKKLETQNSTRGDTRAKPD